MSLKVSFTGYSHYLKSYYDRGLLPSVKKGLYGEPLTKENRSLEHLIPHVEGGPTEIWNLALASVRLNNLRGSKPLHKVLSQEQLEEYALQFEKVNLKKLWGIKYIVGLLELGKDLGVIKKPSVLEKFKADFLI